jgi:hypothetical protein
LPSTFSDSRTAVKVSSARYVEPLATETQLANNPQTTIGATDTRNWRDLNGDYDLQPRGSLKRGAQRDEQCQFRQADTLHEHPRRDLNGWSARLDGGMAGGRAAPAPASCR